MCKNLSTWFMDDPLCLLCDISCCSLILDTFFIEYSSHKKWLSISKYSLGYFWNVSSSWTGWQILSILLYNSSLSELLAIQNKIRRKYYYWEMISLFDIYHKGCIFCSKAIFKEKVSRLIRFSGNDINVYIKCVSSKHTLSQVFYI